MSGLVGRLPWRGALLAGLAVALGAAVVHADAVVAMVAPSVAGVLALLLLVRLAVRWPGDRTGERRVLRWTLGAFAAHLLLSIVINRLTYAQSDAHVYHMGAVKILQHWQLGAPGPSLPHGKEGFYYLLAGLFWMFGVHDIAGLVVNAVLAAATVPLVSDTTYRLFGRESAAYAPPLALFLPGLLLWTSQLLKEAAIVLLIALAANCAMRLGARISVGPVAGMITALVVLLTFRSFVGVVVAAGLLVGVALGRRSVVSGLAAGLGVLALIAALVLASGFGYSGYQAATGSSLRQAELVRRDLANSANSGFAADTDISTPAQALSFLPQGLLNFLLGPFPWQLGGGRQLLVLPDVLVWWLLLPSVWRGLREARRRGKASLVLILPAMTTSALLSLVVGNFGTIVRERSQVVILLTPIMAAGLAVRRRRRGPVADVGDEVEPRLPGSAAELLPA